MIEPPPSSRGRPTVLPDPPRERPLTPRRIALVKEGHPLVKKAAAPLAARYRGLVTEDELVSAGSWGLITAARSFDPDAGFPFDAFAAKHIRGAMLHALRKEAKERRRHRDRVRSLYDDDAAPTASDDADATGLHDYAVEILSGTANLAGDACRTSRAGELAVVSQEMRSAAKAAMAEALEEFSDSRRALVLLHYKEGRSLREAAELLGVSYATVRRRIEEVTEWFRRRLRALRGTPVPFSEGG